MSIRVPDVAIFALIVLGMIAGGASYGASRSLSANTQQQAPPSSSQEPAQPHSIWDGVYTAEQAKRGEPLYYRVCSSCHGDKLDGIESAPPLAGPEFLGEWKGKTVGALFERIRRGMPQDEPGLINSGQKADILAYILSFNKFPAGKSELQQQAEFLKEIKVEMAKPEAAPQPAPGK